eukprot:256239-Chlamydomonas_euryale.AAC.1
MGWGRWVGACTLPPASSPSAFAACNLYTVLPGVVDRAPSPPRRGCRVCTWLPRVYMHLSSR